MVTRPVRTQSALPTRLLQQADFVHQGSFTLPDAQDTTGNYGFEYAQGVLAFNPAKNSLFVVGHVHNQQIAEVGIPAMGGKATLLQPFKDGMEGRLNQINPSDPNSKMIGGLTVIGDKLVIAAYSYYDGAITAVSSHFVRSTTLSASGVQGPFKVGDQNPAFYAGYFTPVPSAWQAALGGSLLNGQCCLGIISRTSYGPSISTVNPADLVAARNPTPASMLVGYPEAHQTLSGWASTGPLFNGTTIMRGALLPEGSATVFFFGRHGMGTFCYGEPTTCNDPEDSGKGTHAYPYEPHVWAYNAADLAAVRSGSKQPWDVKPYATFRMPVLTKAGIGGVAVDPTTGRIFVSEQFGDGAKLRIHVFTIKNGTTGTLPPPPTTTIPPTTTTIPPTLPPPPPPPAATQGWTLSWSDEFDSGAVDTSRWNVENSATTSYGGSLAYYRTQNAVAQNGVLSLVSKRESYSGKSYTSGAVTTKNKVTFGGAGDDFRLEIRAKLPGGQGVWPAIWTREGTMPNPDTGTELDIMELLGHEPTRVYLTQHVWQSGTHIRRPAACEATDADYTAGFHTYTIEQKNGTLRWYLDGVEKCVSGADLPSQPSYLIINTNLGGSWPDAIGRTVTSSTPFPQSLDLDYVRLYRPGTGGTDTTAPSVSLTAPSANSSVSGMATLSASATDSAGVAGVWFTVDGATVGSEVSTAPYRMSWNSRSVSNGSHVIRAMARDTAGNSAGSTSVTVAVNNTTSDTTAPVVTVTSPAAGATIGGTVTLTATANDNVGVAGVRFTVDGANVGSEDTSAPYSVSWTSTGVTNAVHVVRAVARDAAGNTTTSAGVSVTVQNATTPPPTTDTVKPTVGITAPSNGSVVSGTVTISAAAKDNVGIKDVTFYRDGQAIAKTTGNGPHRTSWYTTYLDNGVHEIWAVARDAAGNSTTSARVRITVRNSTRRR